jgi:hypothetical protein
MKRLLTFVLLILLVGAAYAGGELASKTGTVACIPTAVAHVLS